VELLRSAILRFVNWETVTDVSKDRNSATKGFCLVNAVRIFQTSVIIDHWKEVNIEEDSDTRVFLWSYIQESVWWGYEYVNYLVYLLRTYTVYYGDMKNLLNTKKK
jgi:hypothetical protein